MCCIQLLNESFSVKTANSNVMLTLREFPWYPYFVAPEYIVSGIQGKQITTVAFSAKITIIIYIRVFRAAVNTYVGV